MAQGLAGKEPPFWGAQFRDHDARRACMFGFWQVFGIQGANDIGLVATAQVVDYLVPVVLRSRPS